MQPGKHSSFTNRLARRVPFGGPLALLIAGALLGLAASYDPALGQPALWTLFGSVALLLLVVNSAAYARWWAGALVLSATLLALYFVTQYTHLGYAPENSWSDQLGRLSGGLLPEMVLFTPQPNALAAFVEGALPLAMLLAWHGRSAGRWFWALAAATIAYALFVSGSRGAWIGLAVALALAGWLRLPARWRWPALGASTAAALLLLIGLALLPAVRTPLLERLAAAAASRLILYRNSLYLLLDYPLTGIGPGETFAMLYSRYLLRIPVPFLAYSHNLFLSVALEMGALGLLGLLGLLGAFYRWVAHTERTAARGPMAALFRAAWLGATVTWVHGLTDSPQFSPSRWTMPVWFVLLGLTIAAGRQAAQPADDPSPDPRTRRLRRWAAAAAAVALLVTALACWRPLFATAVANAGAICQARAELSTRLDDDRRATATAQAVRLFERALELVPDHPIANRRLGLLALDRYDFASARTFLERADASQPGHPGTHKTLGLALLWMGELDASETLLRRLDDRQELIEELGVWQWWWGTQDRADLADHAGAMIERLTTR